MKARIIIHGELHGYSDKRNSARLLVGTLPNFRSNNKYWPSRVIDRISIDDNVMGILIDVMQRNTPELRLSAGDEFELLDGPIKIISKARVIAVYCDNIDFSINKFRSHYLELR